MNRLLPLIGCLTGLTFTSLHAADVRVTDFGATANDLTLDTEALQRAIDEAHAKGGGRVVFTPGFFRSGSLFLKQGVELHLEKDAVLLGSNNIADYPKRTTRIEGHFPEWRMALVNAQNLTGVRITGPGKIDGNGILFWAAFWQRRKENRNLTNLEIERPRMFFIDRCNDVRLEGLTLRDSGFWNVHLYRCRDVVIEGLDIATPGQGGPVRAPSTDGIDIDSCQNVTVRRCKISVDDDCIALKGTKGPLALQDESSPPVENILIEDCEFGDGHGVLTCGSEATIVRNVTVRNCKIGGKNNVVRLKLRPDTPQLYENLTFENLTLVSEGGRLFDVKPWTQFFDLKGHAPPSSTVRNITVKNVTGRYGSLGVLNANALDTVENITLENVNLGIADDTFELGKVTNLVTRNVTINGKPFVAPAPASARR
ncbi:MAG: right-handed parallel beta-helix repeat-containing protein [Opitutaceae bacterium]|nr:right-handed parallel beta-helix repeat-containing protein [Opitutaceae bacterium]